jgi:hypothetical protein
MLELANQTDLSLIGLICIMKDLKLLDCVLLRNDFELMLTSDSGAPLKVEFIRCILPPGPLTIEMMSCTIQSEGKPMIDSVFCATIIPRTVTPTAFFTARSFVIVRFRIFRMALFLVADARAMH